MSGRRLAGLAAIVALLSVAVVSLVDAQTAPVALREYSGNTLVRTWTPVAGTPCYAAGNRRLTPTDRTVCVVAPTTTQPPATTEPPVTTAPPTTAPPTTQPPTTVPPTTAPPTTVPPSGAYVETFSDPNAHLAFDWQLHSFGGYSSFPGDHDAMCGDPTTTRTINVPDGDGIDRPLGDSVWWCRDHMMTAHNGEGYAQLDFAPARTFENISKVCWDQNMTDLGERKWTQMVVVPEATFQANGQRLDYIEPGFEFGPGEHGIFPLPPQTFMIKLLRGSTQTYVGTSVKDENFLGFRVSDKARRYKTCVTDLNNGTVRVELERATTTEVRIQGGSLPNGPVRVIFQDVSYNPDKAGAGSYTWHWDNLTVS